MFTYLKLKNFKSLKDVTLNLKETQKKTKKFIAIYGENGSGKTNLVSAFDALQRNVISKVVDRAWNAMPRNYQDSRILMGNMEILPSFLDTSLSFENLKMIDEKEPTEIEYGFSINDVEGYYYIKFDTKILEERLYYLGNKKRDIHFEIKLNDGKIEKYLNEKIFNGVKYRSELEEQIDKYWGRHTFLSILFEELTDKNNSYIVDNISDNLIEVIHYFSHVIIKHDKITNIPGLELELNGFNIEEGRIESKDADILNKYEKVLKIFFMQGYADIKDVYYEKQLNENEVTYRLFFKKLIANQIRNICYKDESSGTRRILKMFNNIIETLNGKVVIIDEIDNGIHDLLIKNIIMSLKDEITGQLIITTHNTLLLETLPAKELYIITVDLNGNKEINCVNDYDFKIQKHNNVRDLYFKGVFGGIPSSDYIDFEEIKNTLVNDNQEEGK